MKKLIITSYTIQENGSLVLRNNWIEDYSAELLNEYNVCGFERLKYASLPISGILVGKYENMPNVKLHIRIITI